MGDFFSDDRTKIAVGYFRRASIIFLLYLVHSYLYNYVGMHTEAKNLNLMTSFDRLFPFIPAMVYPYVSLYVGIFMAALFLKGKDFLHFVNILVAIELLTYPVFYFFPAVYPMPHFQADNFTTRFLRWCFQADVHNNTFPSLHVSLAMGTALVIRHAHKKIGVFAITWAIIVSISTVLVKKHFFIDILGGMLVAQTAYGLMVKSDLSATFINTLLKKWRTASAYLALAIIKLDKNKILNSKVMAFTLLFFGLK